MTDESEHDAVAYDALHEAESLPSPERVARMIAVNMGYAQAYMDGDFEKMLEFLVDEPVFELHPPSVRVVGREAVLERSRRLFGFASQNDSRTAADTHRITASTAGQDVLIHEFNNVYTFPDGSQRRCFTVAVIPFIGDKMVGERIYSDVHLGRLRTESLGEDFYDLPGVVRL